MSATALSGETLGVATDRPARRWRLDSVDLLRRLAMVIMALDHTRDSFTRARFDPTDLGQTSPALFLTRWITHVCPPFAEVKTRRREVWSSYL